MRLSSIAVFIAIIFVGCASSKNPYQEKYFIDNKVLLPSINFSIPKGFWTEHFSEYYLRFLKYDSTKYNSIALMNINFKSRYVPQHYIQDIEPTINFGLVNSSQLMYEYYKVYDDFIDGLKCSTKVVNGANYFLRGAEDKFYYTTCHYYSTEEKNYVKSIYFNYAVNFNHFKNTIIPAKPNKYTLVYFLEKFSWYKNILEEQREEINKRHQQMMTEIQEKFKIYMKEVFDSVKIKDMDREKMQKEGLLYDNKYDISSEDNAENISYSCTLLEKGEIEIYECKQREEQGIINICNVINDEWTCEKNIFNFHKELQ